MCSIVGAVLHNLGGDRTEVANAAMAHLWGMSHERGRDGRGFVMYSDADRRPYVFHDVVRGLGVQGPEVPVGAHELTFIGNLRAEPTTEFVAHKNLSDQQPYTVGGWSIVHNGTIANDKDLRTGALSTSIDSAAIAEDLDGGDFDFDEFYRTIARLKGSYAILAVHPHAPGQVFVAANYRPVWYAVTPLGTFFASSRFFFPPNMVPQMLEPYSAAVFTARGKVLSRSLRSPQRARSKALIVCSGGLDSVVSAAYAQKVLGYDIHLIHFRYGSRAEGPEVAAVRQVAQELGCELTLFPLNVYSKEDSPLLDPDSKVAGGEEGAEFAHEWVPARNLLLLSVATAFAEARGIETIVLGNNLEEAGAYPDNEPEFIARFNDLLPFAVGDGKRMEVIMPVGNLMKHEIVALGHEIGAPLHATWSCYRAGELHCGTCGPCYMRRKAFQINGLPEVINYANEEQQ